MRVARIINDIGSMRRRFLTETSSFTAFFTLVTLLYPVYLPQHFRREKIYE